MESSEKKHKTRLYVRKIIIIIIGGIRALKHRSYRACVLFCFVLFCFVLFCSVLFSEGLAAGWLASLNRDGFKEQFKEQAINHQGGGREKKRRSEERKRGTGVY